MPMRPASGNVMVFCAKGEPYRLCRHARSVSAGATVGGFIDGYATFVGLVVAYCRQSGGTPSNGRTNGRVLGGRTLPLVRRSQN